jgi:hypothetical protein
MDVDEYYRPGPMKVEEYHDSEPMEVDMVRFMITNEI